MPMSKWVAKRLKHTCIWSNTDQTIDLFTDTAAILDSIVSDIYYGMFRGQIHPNLPPEHPIITIWNNIMAAVSVKRSIDTIRPETQTDPNPGQLATGLPRAEGECNRNYCLVTKHANVEVSGQTIKKYLIKHRWNNWYKPPSKRGTHARIKHVWYAAVQANKTSPIKQENKRNALIFFIECLVAFKIYQTRPNTIKHDQTAPNKVSKTVTCLPPNNVWWCFFEKHLPFFQGWTWS